MPGKEAGAPDFRFSEESLGKMQTPATFPKLGIENRRETPIIAQPMKVKTKKDQKWGGVPYKTALMANAHGVRLAASPQQTVQIAQSVLNRGTGSGKAGPAGSPITISYARSPAAKQHEDAHMMFNRVHNKYGPKAAMNLANNLYNSIPDDSKEALNQYVGHIYGGAQPPALKHHEEHIAHLLSYLNSSNRRDSFHSNQMGHFDPEVRQEFHGKMKRAHKAVQTAAKLADVKWTKKVMKNPLKLNKSEEWEPTLQQELVAGDMARCIRTRSSRI